MVTPEEMGLSRLRAENGRLERALEIIKKAAAPAAPAPGRGGTPGRKRLTDSRMPAPIRAIRAGFKGAYGSPRMVRELRARGFSAGKERAERPVRGNGIHARHKRRHKRRHKVTAGSKHGLPAAANLPDGHFTPAAPNGVRAPGITYL
ncbi:MAG: IS3 family transposase [Betaproteobacteria bacterium]|nr:IS3 family transposase [Betaproteobacteria bacterium]